MTDKINSMFEPPDERLFHTTAAQQQYLDNAEDTLKAFTIRKSRLYYVFTPKTKDKKKKEKALSLSRQWPYHEQSRYLLTKKNGMKICKGTLDKCERAAWAYSEHDLDNLSSCGVIIWFLHEGQAYCMGGW